jgi:hypothetical protein
MLRLAGIVPGAALMGCSSCALVKGGHGFAHDPAKNVKGTLRHATTGANGRAAHLFFNLSGMRQRGTQGIAPIGKVVAGMDVVESFHNRYGDWPPRGQGPDPARIEVQANEDLESHFPRLPRLDYGLPLSSTALS